MIRKIYFFQSDFGQSRCIGDECKLLCYVGYDTVTAKR